MGILIPIFRSPLRLNNIMVTIHMKQANENNLLLFYNIWFWFDIFFKILWPEWFLHFVLGGFTIFVVTIVIWTVEQRIGKLLRRWIVFHFCVGYHRRRSFQVSWITFHFDFLGYNSTFTFYICLGIVFAIHNSNEQNNRTQKYN